MLSGQYNVVDVFIKNLVDEACVYSRASSSEHQKAIKKEVKSLLNQGMSIHTKNEKRYNAAMYLGALQNKEACLFLWKQGADYLDFIAGAFNNKNGQPFVDEIINNKPHDFIIDYRRIAILAARYGNQQAAENYIAKIASPQNHDYYQLAINGTTGGHQQVAEYFLSKIKPPQKPNYNELAATAAFGGHQQIAEHFLSKITPPETPDYNIIIKAAKQGGHHAIAEHFKALKKREIVNLASENVDFFVKVLVRGIKELAQESNPERKTEIEQKLESFLDKCFSIHAKDSKGLNAAMYLAMENHGKACLLLERKGARFSDMIEGAFKGKHPALVDYLINNGPDDLVVNYSALAGLAAKYGEQHWAENFLNRMSSQNPYYNIVAQGAARGGHQGLAEYFLSKITLPEKPDYMNAAVAAAAGGYQDIADYFLGKMSASEKPDYHLLAAAAAESGHQQVAEYYLGKITAPEKVDYNRIAGYAARGGHRQLAEYYLAKITPPEKPDYDRMATGAVLGGHSQLASYFLGKQKQEQELENNARIAAKALLTFSAGPIINEKHSKKSANTHSGSLPVSIVTTPLRDVSNTITSNDDERVNARNKRLVSLKKQIADGKSEIARLRGMLEEKSDDETTPVMCASKSVTPANAQAKNKSSTPREKSQEAAYSRCAKMSKFK